MLNKFNLTKEENLFLAKKLLVNSIYSSARLEGVNVTFPETQVILDGVNVPRLTIDDILVIRNLRNAWRFVLNNIDRSFGFEFICKVNEEVSREESLAWGVLRTGRIGIGGTDYVPPIPKPQEVIEDITQIMKEGSATEKALNYYMYGCRQQLFWDGNKRTSFICANKILIDNGAGLLHITDNNLIDFNEELSSYYNSGNGINLKDFLYKKCIIGMDNQ